MKIGIVGSGFVGATAAYSMVMQGIGREIVLVDKNPDRASAEADDIYHAVPFAHPLMVRAGEFEDLCDCRVVIVTAGVNQQPSESRIDLLQRNADVFREIIPKIVSIVPSAVLIIATNPVDIMTHIATEIAVQCGIKPQRVLGSGTTLDTARFRSLLGRHYGVDSRHIHAYVVGEHGDSEVLAWSLVTIGGLPYEDFGRLNGVKLGEVEKTQIDHSVRRAAYHIIQGKNATYYGIGAALSRIADVVLHDQRSIMTICSTLTNVEGFEKITIAMPHLFGGEGVIAPIPLQLDDTEAELLSKSANVIFDAINSMK